MTQFSLTEATNLFKINYDKKSENMYNSANVMLGRIKKSYKFTGKQMYVANPLSFSGGVGSGVLPEAGVANYEDANIFAKKVYARCDIEREAIKASADDKGAFIRATKEVIQKCVESYTRNASRILFGGGDGILGKGNATGADVTGNGSVGTPYLVEIPAAFWNEANFEERDLVNVVTGITATAHPFTGGTAEATKLQVVAVNPTTRVVSLVGTSARLAALVALPGPLAASDGIVMQGSYLNDPQGLKSILDLTTGSAYGIPVQRRWSSYFENAANAGITVDRINKGMLEVERRCGKAPTMLVTSFTQYRKIMNQIEDHKRYSLPARDAKLKGQISFSGLEYMTSRGPIGIFADRFCDEDRLYLLNDNFIESHHRPDFGWFDDDGTVFLRKADDDAYEARYGGYYENYIVPTFHGVIDGLAV